MAIKVLQQGPIDVVQCSGKLTIGGPDVKLRETIIQRLDAGVRLFVVDLRRVTFLDSSGLGELEAGQIRVRERGGTVKTVLTVPGKVHQILEITQLDQTFDLFTDNDKALASLKAIDP